MKITGSRVVRFVMRVQQEFLSREDLALTASEASRRFHTDVPACEAVLEALADSQVLSRSLDGRYRRRVSDHPLAA
jgi:hypothetical protein